MVLDQSIVERIVVLAKMIGLSFTETALSVKALTKT